MVEASNTSIILALIGCVQAIVLAYFALKMARLEKNTNSMKDALVATTRDASHAEGVKDEKLRQQDINTQVEAAKKIAP